MTIHFYYANEPIVMCGNKNPRQRTNVRDQADCKTCLRSAALRHPLAEPQIKRGAIYSALRRALNLPAAV